MNKIDRKTAAKQLKVSLRTIDRYVKAKAVKSQRRNGRIWLDKKEITRLKRQKTGTIDIVPRPTQNKIDMSIDSVYSVSTLEPKISATRKENEYVGVYKKLFEELQNENKERQRQLEGANYRVGQLEGQLKDSIPLLDHQKMLTAENTKVSSLQQKLETIKAKLKEEKINKLVYLIILFIMMMLQPLWLFLSMQ